MSILFEQIKFFRDLKLNPISKRELQRWELEIEKHLKKSNKITECHVSIDQKKSESFSGKQSSRRILRLRKKKQFCKMCE